VTDTYLIGEKSDPKGIEKKGVWTPKEMSERDGPRGTKKKKKKEKHSSLTRKARLPITERPFRSMVKGRKRFAHPQAAPNSAHQYQKNTYPGVRLGHRGLRSQATRDISFAPSKGKSFRKKKGRNPCKSLYWITVGG